MKVHVTKFKQRSGGKHIYHTDPECSFMSDSTRERELAALHEDYSECEWCAGVVEGSDGGDKSRVTRLESMDTSEFDALLK